MPKKKGKRVIKKPKTPAQDKDSKPLQGSQRKYHTRYNKKNTGKQDESDGFWEPITNFKDEFDERAPNYKKNPQLNPVQLTQNLGVIHQANHNT